MNPESFAPVKPLRVAFLGFSEFERTSLAAYFRLAGEREPRYQLVYTLTDADFLVADADHAPSVQLVVVTERLAETVFIGSQVPAGAAGSMRRPIDALHVMRALDALAQIHGGGAAPSAAVASVATAARVTPVQVPAPPNTDVIVESMLRMPPPWALPSAEATKPMMPAARALPTQPAHPAPPRRLPDRSALAHPQRPPQPRRSDAVAPVMAFVGPPPPPRALLIDDSQIALRFLATRLEPWCLRTDGVNTSAQAMEKLAERAYDFIFLDVELGTASELDGLALCRHIKRSELAINATLVMVSAHHSEIDRARGSLAGCDAYLGKPLKGSELAVVLRRYGLVPPEGAPVRTPASAGTWPA